MPFFQVHRDGNNVWEDATFEYEEQARRALADAPEGAEVVEIDIVTGEVVRHLPPANHASSTSTEPADLTYTEGSAGWSRSDRIALVGVVLVALALIATFFVPEVRERLGLEKHNGEQNSGSATPISGERAALVPKAASTATPISAPGPIELRRRKKWLTHAPKDPHPGSKAMQSPTSQPSNSTQPGSRPAGAPGTSGTTTETFGGTVDRVKMDVRHPGIVDGVQIDIGRAQPAQQLETSPQGSVLAPYGIAIGGNSTVVNPTVNNFGPPPPPTPNVRFCVTNADAIDAAGQYPITITFQTDTEIVEPWYALFFDGPVLDGKVEMGQTNVFAVLTSRADKLSHPENSFVFKITSTMFGVGRWEPGEQIKATVPSKTKVKLMKIISGAGENSLAENFSAQCGG